MVGDILIPPPEERLGPVRRFMRLYNMDEYSHFEICRPPGALASYTEHPRVTDMDKSFSSSSWSGRIYPAKDFKSVGASMGKQDYLQLQSRQIVLDKSCRILS